METWTKGRTKKQLIEIANEQFDLLVKKDKEINRLSIEIEENLYNRFRKWLKDIFKWR